MSIKCGGFIFNRHRWKYLFKTAMYDRAESPSTGWNWHQTNWPGSVHSVRECKRCGEQQVMVEIGNPDYLDWDWFPCSFEEAERFMREHNEMKRLTTESLMTAEKQRRESREKALASLGDAQST